MRHLRRTKLMLTRFEDLSPHDQAEVQKFRAYLRQYRLLLDSNFAKGEAQRKAHDEVYGPAPDPETR